MAKDRSRSADAVKGAPSSRSGGDSGLTRWSRRKAMARAAQESAVPVQDPAADGRGRAAAESAAGKTDADMPPIDSLHQDSDYAAFLSPQVSEKLRRMALRKLFQLPQFNFCDGLDDYAEDYTNFTPLGDIITADMRHRMERELKALKERLQTETGGAQDHEKPAEAVATTGHSGDEPAAVESPDGPEGGSAPVAGTPETQDPSKG